jgi:hypothetical protein
VRADLSSCPSFGMPGQGHFEGAWREGEEGEKEGEKESDGEEETWKLRDHDLLGYGRDV